MGLDAIALAQVYQIVKNSDKMSKGLDAAEKAIINKGLELIEEAGVDPNTLPFDVRALLRGELPAADPSALLTPEIICAQPLMTVQQKEKVTRLVNSGQDKVQDLVDLTDSISNTVLKLQEPVNRLQQKIIPAEESITLTSEIVQILKLLALPTSIGTVGQPNSVNNTFASILITLSEYLQTGSANIKTVQAALMGEMYQFNKKIAYMSVPDRSIFLLTQAGIKLSYNEHLAIKLHDGLYDPANESYFKSFMVETKPRTSLIYIIHHADMMASRIEFEKEWLPTFKNNVDEPKKNYTLKSNKKTSTKSKALNTIKSEGLKNLFDKL